MATHVRAAILELSGVPKPMLEPLLNDPFDKPLGHWPLPSTCEGASSVIRGHWHARETATRFYDGTQ